MGPPDEMMTEWVNEGETNGASYLIIVWDESSQYYTPIFVYPEQELREEVAKARLLFSIASITTLKNPSLFEPLLVSRVEH